ncbi:hypothetical protein NKH77_32610 [Streptomyces sp. M19]
MTEDELAGGTGRVRAAGLLRHSVWTPHLRGLEPYTDLVRAVGKCVAAPEAVLEFGYDWRLSVAVNARILADRARRHLQTWRATEAHRAAVEHRVDQRPGRLVFVAHSMGPDHPRRARRRVRRRPRRRHPRGHHPRHPFHGAVKAAVILNTGRGTPYPCRTGACAPSARTCPACTTCCRGTAACATATTCGG